MDAMAPPLESCVTLQLLPLLISERLPPGQMNDIIIWSLLEMCVSLTQLEGCCRGGFPNCSGWLGVVAKREARDIFPVSNCKGYMNTPWALGVQACKAALHASRKDW